MCRSIKTLRPPYTDHAGETEYHAAALQYVRKVSGLRAPTKQDDAAFQRAVREVTTATARLLANLPERGEARTRERERDKARAKWTARAARIGNSVA